jgi:16S rRNA (guanine1207-N2)-methyltransferase
LKSNNAIAPTESASPTSIPIAEHHAALVAGKFDAKQVLCTSLGRAQGAWQIAQARPQAAVTCWFLDQYRMKLAHREVSNQGNQANLQLVCQADFPETTFDLAVLPFSTQGEAELTRDLLQAAYQQLAIGGHLITSVNNAADRWLYAQLKLFTNKIEVLRHEAATVYHLTKTAPLKRVRSLGCLFKFRDGENLVQAYSRPGVFSHRHIDPGARQLLGMATLGTQMKVLDIGCGCGTVGLALAQREPSVQIHAVDSNARAVACTLQGSLLNGSSAQVTAELNCDGISSGQASFDLVVANPPYYADFRIADHFVQTAEIALKPGGQLLLVTKAPDWYEERLAGTWRHVKVTPSKQYFVVQATAAD